MDSILSKYVHDGRIAGITSQASAGKPIRAVLNNLAGSQHCFVLYGILQQLHHHRHIYIANDKEEAAYVFNTLSYLVGNKDVIFFPDSFKRPQLFEEINNNNVVERTEVVNQISLTKHEKLVLVTYPEALFEKVVDPALLEKERISIKAGESMDVDTIIEVLIGYGFERADFVYEPGHFSIRGGIVDIFSFANEWPYRIELFDEEVESIRSFNPSTQLSIDKLEEISIIPNINSSFKQNQKVSFFSLFNQENTFIWFNDADTLLDKLQICFEKAEYFATSIEGMTNDEMRLIFEERAFVYPMDITQGLSSFHIIQNAENNLFGDTTISIDYGGKPQPAFNKNFDLLIENLHQNTAEGLETYIFSENAKQIERFYNIFEDLGAQVQFHPIIASVHEGFVDKTLQLVCYTDHEIFQRFHRYKLRQGFTKDQAMSLRMLREMEVGDFVVHIDHGVGKFSGLEKIDINGHVQESVRLIYLNNDILYVGINSLHKISKFVGKDGTPPALSKIGGDAWKNLKRKTKSKVKDIAQELIKLYALRRASKGFAFAPDTYLQTELEASFIYEDTPDQMIATQSVKEDMEKEYPMDRLICGDVGFGKTEIAVRAAFKAIAEGKQVAILVPTTILALQHYQTFSARLKDFHVKCDYLNRFKSAKEKKAILEKLKNGELELVIGTHAILSKDIQFKDLGLLIIDEEQKFGVAAKEKLRSIKVNVDTLTLTATPIPRTLQFSLMAARDLSIIRTPPPNRQPIHTERRVFSDELVKDAIHYEVNRGGQVFFVHNRVKSLHEISELIKRLCPDVQVKLAHGQMESDHLENVLVAFIEGEFDVLVSTNIIETGLDIPNANTIIINNANQFGMSDLHQLRGRVGRSNRKAFCYLFAPPLSVLTEDARKRLKTLEEFSELGSGFQISMKDLDIRGAGNLLGAEQSGFITDIGYETFQKILEEAVMELKETTFQELFKDELSKRKEYVKDVEIDTDIEMLIPDSYVTNIQERLSLYTELDDIENEDGITVFKEKLRDRFGKLPFQVEELFNGLRLRWKCRGLGFERLSLKNNKLRLYFISNAQSSYFETAKFKNILSFLAGDGQKLGFTMKQTTSFLLLSKDHVKNLKEASHILTWIEESV